MVLLPMRSCVGSHIFYDNVYIGLSTGFGLIGCSKSLLMSYLAASSQRIIHNVFSTPYITALGVHPQNSTKRAVAVLKDTLEQACLDEAQWQFTQAAKSPLLQLPEEKGLGSLQIGSPAFLQILDGTYLYNAILDP